MSGTADGYYEEFQRDLLPTGELLEHHKREALELFDYEGVQAAKSCFYDGFRAVMERDARHGVLKEGAIHAMFTQAGTADREEFEALIDNIIEHVQT